MLVTGAVVAAVAAVDEEAFDCSPVVMLVTSGASLAPVGEFSLVASLALSLLSSVDMRTLGLLLEFTAR